MAVKKRELILGYVVAGLVAIWVVVKVVFSPFHEKLISLNKEAGLQEARLKKSFSLIRDREDLKKEYDQYAAYFSLKGSSDEAAVANFLKEIEKVSRSSGLTIIDMKPQKEVKRDTTSKQYQINIKAETTLRQLVGFLYSLHGSSLLLSVEKMVLTPKGEETSILSAALTVVGVAFI